MRIQKDDKSKTVYKTHYSHFKYQVILFSLTIILAIFQCYINKILVEKFDVFLIIYLDHILIYTKKEEENYIKVV